LTTALAYRASSEIPINKTRGESAAHDLAVVWAITHLADSMPATIDDRAALEEARAQLSALADLLGTDDVGLKCVLEEHYTYDATAHRRPTVPP